VLILEKNFIFSIEQTQAHKLCARILVNTKRIMDAAKARKAKKNETLYQANAASAEVGSTTNTSTFEKRRRNSPQYY